MVKQTKPFKDKAQRPKPQDKKQPQISEEDVPKDENMLKLGSFHRFGKKHRKPTLKKKVRDLERFLEHAKLDEEAMKAKREQLKELKKGIKDQKEATRKHDLYKSVKFFERRKIERKLAKIRGQLENPKDLSEEEKTKLEDELHKYTEDVFYVKNFPEGWKYIALYPKEDSELSKKKRAELRVKIKKMVEFKKKLREEEAKRDQEEEDAEEKALVEEPAPAKMDDFFFAEMDDSKVDNNTKIQKKVVDKEGNIVKTKPKPQKSAKPNSAKRQNAPGAKSLNKPGATKNPGSSEHQTGAAPEEEQAAKKLNLKINPKRYRAIVSKTTNSKPVHMKF